MDGIPEVILGDANGEGNEGWDVSRRRATPGSVLTKLSTHFFATRIGKADTIFIQDDEIDQSSLMSDDEMGGEDSQDEGANVARA